MGLIGIGVAAFTITVLAFVGVLLVARSRLVASGAVELIINDRSDEPLEVDAGQTLLEGLSAEGLLLPSACGGQGTCGVCRVKVARGGGPPLPTERAHITPAQAAEGERLACQLKIREDLAIELPADVFGARRWVCRVRSNHNVATFIKELVLDLPEGAEVPFRAGGYVQIECPPHELAYRDFSIDERFRPAWERFGLFELSSKVSEPVVRAYSMASAPSELGVIMLNVRVVTAPPSAPGAPPGKMSSWIFGLEPGDEAVISGPFGEFFARETDAEMVFIGGGAGMAPMRSHILDQLERIGSKRKMTFWYGARSLAEAFYVELFDRLEAEHDNFAWHLALSEPEPEDEWEGPVGFIHQVLRDEYLAAHAAPEEAEYYLCGPPLMLEACKGLLGDLGVPEEHVLADDFGI